MKPFTALVAAMLIIPMAHAEMEPKADPFNAAKEKYRAALKSYMVARDKNHDNSLSKEEFLAAEADKGEALKAYNQANTNGDRALTKTEIASMLGLDKQLEKDLADAEAKAKAQRKFRK